MTESLLPEKMAKAELEQLVKANGGKIFQTHTAAADIICVADKRVVKVASLQKAGETNIVFPSWILACVKQNEQDVGMPRLLLPFEPGHMLFTTDQAKRRILESTDQYADSFARDVDAQELQRILDHMPSKYDFEFDPAGFKKDMDNHQHSLGELRGWMFSGLVIYADCGISTENDQLDNSTGSDTQGPDMRVALARNLARFAGAHIVHSIHDENTTHVLVSEDLSRVKNMRQAIQRSVPSNSKP
ncbi:MAG: hypothetical protein M1812_004146 [Candelaria pacifica]|nr:MAG: hypothetical protein M1812_004146 [Candelaria pacifica]